MLKLGKPVATAGAKPERDQVPGVKLKTENKKPIVGLAVHPAGGHAGACTAGLLARCWGSHMRHVQCLQHLPHAAHQVHALPCY